MAKPDLPRGYLGAQPKFGEFGLSTHSHKDPDVTLTGNEVEIQFKMDRPVKVTGNLIQVSTLKEHTDNIFTQTQGDVVSFLVQIPEPGFYKLQIYALPVSDESKTLPGVFNYILNCPRISKPVHPFPKQYAQWKEGCYIYEPLVVSKDGLNRGASFRVVVPNAKAVAAVVNEEWTQLDNKGNNLWEGKVKGSADKMTLNANFGGEESKYSTLLEYNM
ncbi:uncharacterized protein LOC110464099 [Mizuhopecten yessoensis]|uniref:Kyphoscoliosis peptidase n=1 Tax=Mizuhopecten yessoensis TaxID=6573 RepID=A0A210PUK9_MIZYE|nr:uncharacterized protein LOC110464099 [Mizuhopecten yessoensis]OWF40191.1 Kyphoscoliosis peptidase [Mizuhopecten yessoensis]